ncbi:MAG: STAS domain-containing protein [Methylococcaceae bacterium]|nr:STAS domain-containing protein [Methylococcaceae bacterium]
MNLNLETINGFNVLIIKEERIDAHNSAELKDYLLKMIENGKIRILINLGNVRFIDSSGLGALLSGNKQIAVKSGKLALINIQKQVLSMFELTRLNRVFEIYADLNEALSSET